MLIRFNRHFVTSLKAPMVVDWLTDLGQSLAETFRKVRFNPILI
eukprot:COSAG04_NODE_593_length_12275_cov_8.681915_11_plen_44_part_00